MKIAVIGATGMAGRAIFEEATTRGHEVTGYCPECRKGTCRTWRRGNAVGIRYL